MSVQRIICDKELEDIKLAQLPFIIATKDGVVGEADSIRGLISLVIPEYMDAEDNVDDWNLRVQYARKQAMFAIQENINIEVYDKTKGKINNNYAAATDDEDYEEFNEQYRKEKVYVESEINFLMSLSKLGMIKFLQRSDQDLLGNKVTCEKCSHNKSYICDIYKSKIDNLKEKCESGIFNIEPMAKSEYFLIIE